MSVTPYETQDGTRWRYRIYNPVTRRTDIGEAGFRSERRAKREEANAIAARDAAGPGAGVLDAGTMTVRAWRDLWLKVGRKQKTIGESTEINYRERTSSFVAAYGDELIGPLGYELSLTWLANDGQGIPELSAMWSAARKARIVTDNIWGGMTKRGRRQIQPGWLTAADLAKLVNAGYLVHGPTYGRMAEAMVLMGAYVGLRPGELAGLRWEDLHPESQELHVGQQANSTTKKMTLPKGGKERDVAYPPVVIEAVARMGRMHPELVFVSKRGRVLFGSQRDKVWSPMRAAAGRPDLTMHQLRHHTATLILEQGLSSADAAIQLGHQDGGRLVEQTYGHPRHRPALARVREAQSAAAAALVEEAVA